MFVLSSLQTLMKELKLEITVASKTIYKFGYLLIMFALITALIEFGSVVSGANSVMQSNLFVHRYFRSFSTHSTYC